MAKIIKANGLTWEQMVKTGYYMECKHDCQVGDIIDDCFVYCGRTPMDNTLKKGDVTYLIPLSVIAVAETHADLFEYGFIKVSGTNRWIRLH